MDRFNVVANMVQVAFVGLADWLYGCSHRRTTFPITLRAGLSVDGQQSTQAETYVVCVECGRHFAYDWTTMHITKQRPAWLPGLGRISDQKDVARGERLFPRAVRSGLHRDAEPNSVAG
jgi:hypothetical protein